MITSNLTCYASYTALVAKTRYPKYPIHGCPNARLARIDFSWLALVARINLTYCVEPCADRSEVSATRDALDATDSKDTSDTKCKYLTMIIGAESIIISPN